MKTETNPIVNKLKKKYGKVVAFKDLPLGFKLALIWYMGIDGEAWTTPDSEGDIEFIVSSRVNRTKALQKFFTKNMGWFDEKYGKEKFGMAMVPREEYEAALLANFRKNPDMNHLHSMKDFLKEYKEGGPTVNHKDASWPVIFSSFADELIQDGWHRQHCYLNKNIPTIPCVYYIH